MVQKPKTQSGWGFSVKQGAATNHGDSTDSSLTMAVEAVIHALRWIASRGDSQATQNCAVVLTDATKLLQKLKLELEARTGKCQFSTATFGNSCGVLPWTCRSQRS